MLSTGAAPACRPRAAKTAVSGPPDHSTGLPTEGGDHRLQLGRGQQAGGARLAKVSASWGGRCVVGPNSPTDQPCLLARPSDPKEIKALTWSYCSCV